MKTQGEFARNLQFTYMYLSVAYAGVYEYETALAYLDKSYQLMAKLFGEDYEGTKKAKAQFEEYKEKIIQLMNKQS